MTAAGEAFFTDYFWPNFWRDYGSLVFLAIAMQVLAVIMFVLWLQHVGKSGSERVRRIPRGRTLGVVGGLIAPIGVFLPWVAGLNGASRVDGIFVFVFGILALEFVAIPTQHSAVVGGGWGILALAETVPVIQSLESAAVEHRVQMTFDYGLYITILGILLLIAGSVLALVEARMVGPSTDALLAEAPHETSPDVAPRSQEYQNERK